LAGEVTGGATRTLDCDSKGNESFVWRVLSPARVACCNLRKRPVIGWRRRGCLARCASALGRFATFNPGVKLEVQIGVSAELIEQLIRLVVGIPAGTWS
jgi:hypothetical protein